MSSSRVVSDWHLNERGEWENHHGWIARPASATDRTRGIIWIGYRPAADGHGDLVDGRRMDGWGELWAPDLETIMQRVDRASGMYERLAEHAAGRLPAMGRALRDCAVAQLELGLWAEAS